MRTARLFGEGVAYYHCISRVVDKRYIFDDLEKVRFRKMMRKMEAFTGVNVVTYVIMSNHFHLLLKVDSSASISDEEVICRVSTFYGSEHAELLKREYQAAIKNGYTEGAKAIIDRYRHRMNNLSQFMKELKQRYSIAYNNSHGRCGTLWEERFESLLVEGEAKILSMTAAYIELNPVRAGIVEDPKDYPFSGYGEACAGKTVAQRRLTSIMNALGVTTAEGWSAEQYRVYLFQQGITYQKGGTGNPKFIEQAEKVLAQGGVLPLNELLYCRIRYLSAGVAFGSRGFINNLFKKNPAKFGAHRKTGARPIACQNQEICTFRDIQVAPVTISRPKSPPD